ncbi:NADPH-dependent FMN reductase [Palleronia caenipelagi]|uniref:NAD(P)H-dependent oxidoreductase n=1 Tax=Palleronia caenipelagi TaxID=2489174 RepID=A0A547Q5I6_9RHOB|nr:NAD(P)H-dependent oxidoreductase [Palleronia caenipelagi]TRD21644.1 NAD(P)H-dependent oxidoreductase [Palleronia caenipelagi]
MKILAFGASTSRDSINAKLATLAANRFKAQHAADAEIMTVDLNDYEMPLYSIDRETADGIPANAHALFEKIGSADALIISFAEHNGNYTAAWKNSFDWMSRIDGKVYQDRPMVILATSPGPGGATSVLNLAENSAQFFGTEIKGKLSVPVWNEAYDAENDTLTSDTLLSALDEALSALAG